MRIDHAQPAGVGLAAGRQGLLVEGPSPPRLLDESTRLLVDVIVGAVGHGGARRRRLDKVDELDPVHLLYRHLSGGTGRSRALGALAPPEHLLASG